MPQSRKRKQCANSKLPVDPTDSFREKILGLAPSVRADYLKSEIFSKFVSDDTDPAEVRRNRAIFKWLCTERENEATNDRLLMTRPDYQILPGVEFAAFVDWVQQFIAGIIGEVPSDEALYGSFSGGASTSRTRTESHPAGKYLGKADVTMDCLALFSEMIGDMPGWISMGSTIVPNVVPGNVLFTVPKKTDIDRCACKEPDLNMFIQKGLGAYIRKCLLHAGVNLNDQSINRSLARKGSFDNSLATLDLSSASDSVSTGLVSLLLPEHWHALLDTVRSRVTIIDGEEHRNHMFSSMGNGFTFELESLLFFALAKAVCRFGGYRGRVSVYGDDIIVPTRAADDLIWVLGYFGFQVNPDKTFTDGPFRESCGGHYWNGRDITPFYVKHPIKVLSDLIHVANSLRQWASLATDLGILDPEVEEVWLWLKAMVPKRLWGGEDTSFKYQLVSLDEPSHRLQQERERRSTGIGGYFHWLNATWARSEPTEGVQTSSKSIDTNIYRMKPVRSTAVPRLPKWFIHELR